MQDRFKFRAWDKEESKYINDIQECEGGTGSYEPCQMCFGDYFLEYYKCENYIVEQCTGLKDKNGKLIYEGDICKVNQQDSLKGEVVYAVKLGCYTLRQSKTEGISFIDLFDLYKDCSKLEIIGNVHENLELLEEK